MLSGLAGGVGNVVILIGDPANEAAVQRTQGCHNVIDATEGLTFVTEQSGNWSREEGLEITENWIQSGEEFDIICSNNDEMALGAIEALRNADLLDDVIVGGVDATSVALEAMAAGDLEVTVFQNAARQGGGGVEAAVKLVNGEPIENMVDGVIDVPYEPVTPEQHGRLRELGPLSERAMDGPVPIPDAFVHRRDIGGPHRRASVASAARTVGGRREPTVLRLDPGEASMFEPLPVVRVEQGDATG